MNQILDKISIENFNLALDLSSREYNYDELIEIIKSGNDINKQIAILNLEEINSDDNAMLLASNLTGQDGKIREVTAFKLNELALDEKYKKFFLKDENFKKFMNGFMDINGNICRMVINLIQIDEFKIYLAKYLPNRIKNLIDEIKTMNLKSKQYILSKKNFQLYWNLEALSHITKYVDFDEISDFIEYTSSFVDYTIREKSAKIISKYNNNKALCIKNKLAEDENYYVNQCACSSDE